MGEKKHAPGKSTSVRFPIDFPKYIIDFLNDSDVSLTELIRIGAMVKMSQKDEGIFIKYNDLTLEKKEIIEGNPQLQQAVMKIVDDFFFSQKPLFRLVEISEIGKQVEINEEEQEISKEGLLQLAEAFEDELKQLF